MHAGTCLSTLSDLYLKEPGREEGREKKGRMHCLSPKLQGSTWQLSETETEETGCPEGGRGRQGVGPGALRWAVGWAGPPLLRFLHHWRTSDKGVTCSRLCFGNTVT